MKKLQRRAVKALFLAALTLLLTSSIFSQPCSTKKEEYGSFNVNFDNFKVYPSMAPRSYLKISYDFSSESRTFDPTDKANFVIVKKGETDLSKKLKIERIDNFGGVKYIVLDAKSNGLKNGDEINVGLCVRSTVTNEWILYWNTADPDSEVRKGTEITRIDTFTASLTPNVVNDQELIDGTKNTVGQFSLDLDVPSMVRNNNIARVYFNTNNLISTDWKDKNSKVEMKFGAERNLAGLKWFVPGNIEAKVTGDQRVKNATFVLSGGVKSTLPWAWSKKALFNSFIRAPYSPAFKVNTEFHNRIKQDPMYKSKFPGKNSFALSGEFNWSPIQLFTGRCANEKGEPDFDSCFSAKNVSLELSAKGWWFPNEHALTGAKVKRFEGRVEVSLLIPVGNILNQALFQKEAGKITSRIRLKYVNGANDASGFKRSAQFTYGVELIK